MGKTRRRLVTPGLTVAVYRMIDVVSNPYALQLYFIPILRATGVFIFQHVPIV